MGASWPGSPAPIEEEQEARATRQKRAGLVRFGAVAAGGILVGLAIGLVVRGRWSWLARSTPTSAPIASLADEAGELALASPVPAATAIPTPTPTRDPVELRRDADRAAEDGNYGAAAEAYSSLLDQAGPESAPQLLLGMALLRDGQSGPAVEVLEGALEAGLDAESVPLAQFLLAEALAGGGQPARAASLYRDYIGSGTVITGYIQEWTGDALARAGDHLGAIDAYQQALVEATDRAVEVGIREKIALSRSAQGDFEGAIAEYDKILDVAQFPGYRAYVEYQAAETEALAGLDDDAVARYTRIVETSPTEASAHPALVRLLERDVVVDDRLRGIVDFHAEAYEPGILALTRYYTDNPITHTADVHYYAGDSYLALDDPASAAREFSTLIDTHPGADLVDAAWLGLARAHAASGDGEAALYTYQKFVSLNPASPRAAEALWQAALLLERSGETARAAEAFAEAQAQYPGSEYADNALLRSGLAWYREGDLANAAVQWDALASTSTEPYYQAAGLFWLGKVRLVQGDVDGAALAFAGASEAHPASYYGLRAAQMLDDPLAPAFPIVPSSEPPESASDQTEAEAWLAGWAGGEGIEVSAALSEDVARDGRLRRGLELWRLGRFAEARGELEALRIAREDDPLALYQLALLYQDIGLYRSSILAAARLYALSPAESILEVPAFIGRLAYPDYYRRLVTQHAQEFGLDPLLVFSLLRQESLFESLATSSAAAHGLMQVIPPTGEQIAASLGWPENYETADLYKPYVSVRFGTYYLATQRDAFDDRTEVALAAYNGGPGNALRWLGTAGEDPDLFAEMITFSETRSYVRRIREHLAAYQALYAD